MSTLEVVERFNDAFNSGDVDAIMALMTDDAVFDSTTPAPDGRRFDGADAVRKVWLRLFEKTKSPHFDWEEVTAFGDRAIVRWTFSWDNDDGSRGHVRGVDLIRVRNGKVAEKLSYVKG